MAKLEKRCSICGRLCGEKVESAQPYKANGYACEVCYYEQVVPSKKWVNSRFYKYAKPI